MGKINFNEVYADRLRQIDLDMRKAIANKKWTELAKLKAEKARIEEIMNEQ